MKTLKVTRRVCGALAGAALVGVLATPATARASDKEWATAGKILTGVAIADVLLNHLPVWGYRDTQTVATRVYTPPCPPPTYTVVETRYYTPAPTVVYAPAPVVYAPPPVVYVPAPVVCAPAPRFYHTHYGPCRPHLACWSGGGQRAVLDGHRSGFARGNNGGHRFVQPAAARHTSFVQERPLPSRAHRDGGRRANYR